MKSATMEMTVEFKWRKLPACGIEDRKLEAYTTCSRAMLHLAGVDESLENRNDAIDLFFESIEQLGERFGVAGGGLVFQLLTALRGSLGLEKSHGAFDRVGQTFGFIDVAVRDALRKTREILSRLADI